MKTTWYHDGEQERTQSTRRIGWNARHVLNMMIRTKRTSIRAAIVTVDPMASV